MKHKILFGLTAFASLVLARVPAQAGYNCCEPCCDSCCPAPCVATCVSYVDQTVTCYKPEWREKAVTYTVNRLVSHVEVTPVTYTVMVPVTTQKVMTATVYKSVPRVIERDVATCHMVPVTCTDPCTGCCYTCCKAETVVHKVQCTVYDCVPVQHQYTVNVCSYRPEQRTAECKRIVCECKPEVVAAKQRYCVMVPYQTTVKVPVCTPVCATGCCY